MPLYRKELKREFSGNVGAFYLIPQVVDEVEQHVPVIAAGTISDGRRLAAALLLAPQAISDGTLFLASPKIAVSQDFQE